MSKRRRLPIAQLLDARLNAIIASSLSRTLARLKAVPRYSLISVLTAAAITAIYIAAYLYATRVTPLLLRGELSETGAVELAFAGEQRDGISPACGCFAEQSADTWRGITFVARDVEVSPVTASATGVTGYLFTSPLPAEVRWVPGFRVRATHYHLLLPPGYRFDPAALADGTLPAEVRVLEKRHYPKEPLIVAFTRAPMHLTTLGSYPIGAWIPTTRSNVTLRHQRSSFPGGDSRAIIEETFPAFTLPPENHEGKIVVRGELGYPILDFLGPQLVAWTLGDVRLGTTTTLDARPASKPSGIHLHALVLTVPFALRLAVQGWSLDEVDRLHAEHAKSSDCILPVELREYSGTVSLTIPNPRQQASEFSTIYRKMSAENTVIRADSELLEGGFCSRARPGDVTNSTVFRLPPLPPHEGFNIFGAPALLKFSAAKGHLMIGARSVQIAAPSKLELRNIVSISPNAEGPIAMPVQLEKKQMQVQYGFTAIADVLVNDEPVTLWFERVRDQLGLGIALMDVLLAIHFLISFLKRSDSARRDAA